MAKQEKTESEVEPLELDSNGFELPISDESAEWGESNGTNRAGESGYTDQKDIRYNGCPRSESYEGADAANNAQSTVQSGTDGRLSNEAGLDGNMGTGEAGGVKTYVYRPKKRKISLREALLRRQRPSTTYVEADTYEESARLPDCSEYLAPPVTLTEWVEPRTQGMKLFVLNSGKEEPMGNQSGPTTPIGLKMEIGGKDQLDDAATLNTDVYGRGPAEDLWRSAQAWEIAAVAGGVEIVLDTDKRVKHKGIEFMNVMGSITACYKGDRLILIASSRISNRRMSAMDRSESILWVYNRRLRLRNKYYFYFGCIWKVWTRREGAVSRLFVLGNCGAVEEYLLEDNIKTYVRKYQATACDRLVASFAATTDATGASRLILTDGDILWGYTNGKPDLKSIRQSRRVVDVNFIEVSPGNSRILVTYLFEGIFSYDLDLRDETAVFSNKLVDRYRVEGNDVFGFDTVTTRALNPRGRRMLFSTAKTAFPVFRRCQGRLSPEHTVLESSCVFDVLRFGNYLIVFDLDGYVYRVRAVPGKSLGRFRVLFRVDNTGKIPRRRRVYRIDRRLDTPESASRNPHFDERKCTVASFIVREDRVAYVFKSGLVLMFKAMMPHRAIKTRGRKKRVDLGGVRDS